MVERAAGLAVAADHGVLGVVDLGQDSPAVGGVARAGLGDADEFERQDAPLQVGLHGVEPFLDAREDGLERAVGERLEAAAGKIGPTDAAAEQDIAAEDDRR